MKEDESIHIKIAKLNSATAIMVALIEKGIGNKFDETMQKVVEASLTK